MRQATLALLLAAWLLAGCQRELPTYQEQGYVFGTLVEVSIYGEDEAHARQAVAAVMQEFQRLHTMLHAWQPSELSRFNAAVAAGKPARVTPELAELLRDAGRLSAQSHGRFNPAIGGLIQLWGFHADEFKAALPDEKRVAELVRANPQMSDLSIAATAEHNEVTIRSRNKAVEVDLGGYAKGYALDRAAIILHQLGVHDALINIGGNVMALGSHGKRAWRVGIQHPRKPGPLATLELHDGEALGTSGDYQRFFELNGTRYCHLINPATGQPVQGVEAVTVLTHGPHAGTLSDVTSKPLFVAGVRGWRAAANDMGLQDALLIDGSGMVHLTPGMQKRLEFTDTATQHRVEP